MEVCQLEQLYLQIQIHLFNCECTTDTSLSLCHILTYFKTDVAKIFVSTVNSEVTKLCMPKYWTQH
jgi:hypothetical protein